MKIRSMGADLFHADERTDITKLTVAFRNFANAPKNWHTYCWQPQQTVLFPGTRTTCFGSTCHLEAANTEYLKLKIRCVCARARAHTHTHTNLILSFKYSVFAASRWPVMPKHVACIPGK